MALVQPDHTCYGCKLLRPKIWRGQPSNLYALCTWHGPYMRIAKYPSVSDHADRIEQINADIDRLATRDGTVPLASKYARAVCEVKVHDPEFHTTEAVTNAVLLETPKTLSEDEGGSPP